jgi:aspartyl-tRNA(Asn)/glutamyl-tRNA(Gln) amidotransferase subunit B
MRSKEEAADYRYFSDPDLPIISIDQAYIDQIAKKIPELPHQKFERFTTQKGLSAYEADILIEDIALASYFDKASDLSKSKQVINWILRDLLGYLKEHNITIAECKVTPEKLAIIVDMLESGKINNHAAKEVFSIIAQTGQEPTIIVQERGLEQIGSADELEAIIKEIINQNPKNVDEYRQAPDDRKQRLIGFFVGQAMKKTQGKGNPQLIQEILKKLL